MDLQLTEEIFKDYWIYNDDFETFEDWEDYEAKLLKYKGVYCFENYIPLFRFQEEEDCFAMAEHDVIYIWNTDDLPQEVFENIVAELAQQNVFLDKTIKMECDCSGF